MASTLNSANDDLVLNATGGSDLVFQQDGIEKGRVSAGGFGKVLQVVSIEDSVVATGVGVILQDDTIPQNTEGVEFLSASITPKSANSLLKVRVEIPVLAVNSTGAIISCALFRDTDLGAIQVSSETAASSIRSQHIVMQKTVSANSTTLTTFKLRIGSTAGTITFNGIDGLRKYGGVSASSITITEIGA